MKRIKSLAFILALLGVVAVAGAWNLSKKGINALEFRKNGRIEFTLFAEGSSGDEFECVPGGPRGQWFYITPCPSTDATCLSAVDRMASMLLAAKLAGKSVYVHRNACEVTHVALKR